MFDQRPAMDIVTVYHNKRNRAQAMTLAVTIDKYATHAYDYFPVDNTENNRGFGPACNFGAKKGGSDVIGFLNPDVIITGPFMDEVLNTFKDDPACVITGENFGKPEWEYRLWGCESWVCGACFFVQRNWWNEAGGFDERFKWSWEESDLIRYAQWDRRHVKAISLPIRHESPSEDSPFDKLYKQQNFDAGARLFRQKWGTTAFGPLVEQLAKAKAASR